MIRLFQFFTKLFLFSFLLLSAPSLFSDDWQDLREGDEKYYGSDRLDKFEQDSLFWKKEKWPGHYSNSLFWLYKYTDYPKYNSTEFFPFYYRQESKIDKRNRYRIINFSKQIDKESISHSFFPLWFQTNGTTNDSSMYTFFPIFLWQKEITSERKNISFFSLLYLHDQYTSIVDPTKEGIESYSLLWGYNSNKKGSTTNSTFWFPILPLYLSTQNGSEVNRSFLFLSNLRTNNGKVKNAFVFPFLFYNSSKDGHFHIVPFYMNYYVNNVKTYTHIFPFYYKWFTDDNPKDNNLLIFPFYYTGNNPQNENHTNILGFIDIEKDTSGESTSTIVAPFYFYKKDSHRYLFPLFFSNAADKSGSGGSLYAPFYFDIDTPESTQKLRGPYYYSQTKEEKPTTTKNILPFYYSEEKPDSHSTTTIFPLYRGTNRADGSSSKNILGFINWEKDKGNSYKDFNLFPFVYYARDKSNPNAGIIYGIPFYSRWDDQSSTTWIFNYYSKQETKEYTKAFFPFYYNNTQVDGSTHKNILGIINWEKDMNNSYKNFFFLPFAYYSKDESNPNSGYAFGIPFYSMWNENESTTWAFNWYSQHDFKKGEFSKTFFPFYFSWKNEESNGNIFIPISAEYQNQSGEEWNIVLLGMKEKRTGILNSNVSFSGGIKEKRWYLDTDISFLYYFARYSTRVSADIPFMEDVKPATEEKKEESPEGDIEKKDNDLEKDLIEPSKEEKIDQTDTNLKEGTKEKPKDKTPQEPSIQKKKNLNRENSLFFSGINLVFGLYAYEAGDTKRHFRAFPLSWLTWDESKSDKLMVVPPFWVWYQAEDVEYLAAFIFYGKQKEKNSYTKAYGMIGYIDEYEEAENRTEQSYLWPLINIHQSNKFSGHRFYPFYWHKNYLEENYTEKKTISLLHFYNSVTQNSGDFESNLFIYPLLMYRNHFTNKDTDTIERFSILLPHYYTYSKNSSSLTEYLYSPIYIKEDEKSLLEGENKFSEHRSYLLYLYSTNKNQNENSYSALWWLFHSKNTKADYMQWLIPFYYYQNQKNSRDMNFYFFPTLTFYEQGTNSSFGDYNRFTFMLLAFYERHKDNFHETALIPFYYRKREDSDYKFFLGGYYQHNSPSEDRYNFLYLIDKQNTATENKLSFLFHSINYTKDINYTQYSILYGLLYKDTTMQTKSEKRILYFWTIEKDPSIGLNSTNLLPVYYSDSNSDGTNKTDFILGYYKNKTPTQTTDNFLYLWDYTRSKESKDFSFLFNLFSFYSDSKKSKQSIFYSLLMNRENVYGHHTTTNYLYFWESYSNESNSYTSNNFLPFYYHNLDKSKNTSTLFTLGYYHSSSETNKTDNFLYLVDYTRSPGAWWDLSFLFNLLSFYSSATESKQSLFYSILMDRKNNKKSHVESKYLFFWNTYSKHDGSKSEYNFFPFYYSDYSKRETETITHKNILLFTDYKLQDNTFKRFMIFPFYYSNDGYEKIYSLFPLYFQFSFANSTDIILVPLYVGWDSTSSRQNLLYLIDHQKTLSENRYSMLFQSVNWINKSNGEKNFSLLYDLAINYQYNNPKNHKLDLFLLWGYDRTMDKIKQSFVPFFYRNSNANEEFNWIGLGILSYRNENKTSLLQHNGLGILYYDDLDKSNGEEYMHILLGSVYYQRNRTRNGYVEKGSLWGWLWEMQTESDKDYMKFSAIIKLFGFEKVNGKKSIKFMGIKF